MLAAGRTGEGQPVGQRRRLDDDAAELVPPVLALADDVRGGEEEGRRQFADALIAALGARAGCARTLTFDRNALRLPGFELP
jgi:predicted nucleic acid-binding protein